MPHFMDDSKIYDYDFFEDTESIIKSFEEKGILEDATCNGNFSPWYYLTLLVSHIYFLVDYILRLISQKHIGKFFGESESIVEIITNIPILICFLFLNSEDFGL